MRARTSMDIKIATCENAENIQAGEWDRALECLQTKWTLERLAAWTEPEKNAYLTSFGKRVSENAISDVAKQGDELSFRQEEQKYTEVPGDKKTSARMYLSLKLEIGVDENHLDVQYFVTSKNENDAVLMRIERKYVFVVRVVTKANFITDDMMYSEKAWCAVGDEIGRSGGCRAM